MIAFRQGPNRMEVIRQDNHCIYQEGMRFINRQERLAQGADMVRQQRTMPLCQIHRKEIGSACYSDTPVVGHGAVRVRIEHFLEDGFRLSALPILRKGLE